MTPWSRCRLLSRATLELQQACAATEEETMADDRSMTRTVDVAEARAQWDQVIEDVGQRRGRIVIERDGIPVAAVISAADLERLQRLADEWDAPFRVIDRMRAAFSDVPDDELERQVDKAVAEARAELRAEREAAGLKQ